MSIEPVGETLPEGWTVAVTVDGLLGQVQRRVDEANRSGNPHGNAGAEFMLARRHLEDALMRYTRGLAIMLGVFKPADLESEEAIAERRAFLDRVEEARGE